MSKPMAQVKFTIDADIVSAFKARCALADVSMASVISQFMKTSQPMKGIKVKINTRPQRKKAVSEYIGFLGDLMYNEEQYRDAIPEQFELRYETADNTCDQLAQAIANLEDAY
jgi:hypothetical protein